MRRLSLVEERGFSLVSVMIAIGLVGTVSLAVMKLMQNTSQIHSHAQEFNDQLELSYEIRSILENETFCRLSLAGNGPEGSPAVPVQFEKRNIDEDNEGLNVELWLGNQAGTLRTRKVISAIDPGIRKYGKLTLKSIKLIMNNETGINYSNSSLHSDMGKIRLVYEKNGGNTERTKIENFPIMLKMKTILGKTTILSCRSGSLSKELKLKKKVNLIAQDGYTSTVCSTLPSGKQFCENTSENEAFDLCFLTGSSIQDAHESTGTIGTIQTHSCKLQQLANKTWILRAFLLKQPPLDIVDAKTCSMYCYNYE